MLLHSVIAIDGTNQKEIHITSELGINLSNGFSSRIHASYHCFNDIKSVYKVTGSCIVNGSTFSIRIIYLDMLTRYQPIAFYLYDYVTGRTRMFLVSSNEPFFNNNCGQSQFNCNSGMLAEVIQYSIPMNELSLFDIIPVLTEKVMIDRLEKVISNSCITVDEAIQIIYDFDKQTLFELNCLIRKKFNDGLLPMITEEDGMLSFGDNRATCLSTISEYDAIIKLTELPFKSFSVTIDFVNHSLDIHSASFIDDPNIVINGDLCLYLINSAVRDFLLVYCNVEYRHNVCYTVRDPSMNNVAPSSITITKTVDEIVSVDVKVDETIFNRTYDTVAMILVSPYTFSNQWVKSF